MSTNIELRYGLETINATLEISGPVQYLEPKRVSVVSNLPVAVVNALQNPIGSKSLGDLAKKVTTVTIITSDQTRPVPSQLVLPVVCKVLQQAGLKISNMTIIIGVGNHRPVSEAEKEKLLGPLYGIVKCYHSREVGYKFLGITKRGTPVEVASPLAEADLVIALGNIELHQLAGFSGGVKAVAVGAASPRCIEYNHRLSVLQGNKKGEFEDNIVRRDMEEFARIARLDFIINVVLDGNHKVVCLVAGDPVAAHRKGSKFARDIYEVAIEQQADLVIVSPGGAPKDDTVYQAQKTIQNALPAVRDGGIIIAAAKCPEGFGNREFEKSVSQAADIEELAQMNSKAFVLGRHKTAFIAQTVKKAHIYWVSDMADDDVRRLFFSPHRSLQSAVDQAMKDLAPNPRVYIMPYGGVTVPVSANIGQSGPPA